MAFTNMEKIKIRLYLGYNDLYAQFNSYLESAIAQVDQDADRVTLIRDMLAKIEETDLIVQDSIENAGLKRLEDIEFYPDGQQLAYMNKQGMILTKRLAIIIGVAKFSEYFDSKDFPGAGKAYSGVSGYVEIG